MAASLSRNDFHCGVCHTVRPPVRSYPASLLIAACIPQPFTAIFQTPPSIAFTLSQPHSEMARLGSGRRVLECSIVEKLLSGFLFARSRVSSTLDLTSTGEPSVLFQKCQIYLLLNSHQPLIVANPEQSDTNLALSAYRIYYSRSTLQPLSVDEMAEGRNAHHSAHLTRSEKRW